MNLLKLFKRKVPGFSLIELSIVFIIVGVMLGSLLKGKDLLDQANAREVAHEFARIQTAILLYQGGNNSDLLNSPNGVWEKLAAVELLPQGKAPSSKLGGVFWIDRISEEYYLCLSLAEGQNTGFLTLAQTKAICANLEKNDSTNEIIVKNKEGVAVTLGNETNKAERYSIFVRLRR
jgi:type II secretory pathway pseudopilin PulG